MSPRRAGGIRIDFGAFGSSDPIRFSEWQGPGPAWAPKHDYRSGADALVVPIDDMLKSAGRDMIRKAAWLASGRRWEAEAVLQGGVNILFQVRERLERDFVHSPRYDRSRVVIMTTLDVDGRPNHPEATLRLIFKFAGRP